MFYIILYYLWKKITVFHTAVSCTNDAADRLNAYVQQIKNHFHQSGEYDNDVVEDILIACEQKITTLLAESADQTLTIDYIQLIICQLGTVDKMDDIDTNTNDSITSPKLYRDTERWRISGVCAGLAAYFDIPMWVVRLLAVVLIFTPFPTVIAYVILWFVLEPARTKSDYLRLHGKSVSLTTLSSNVSDVTKRRVGSLAKILFIILSIIMTAALALITISMLFWYLHNRTHPEKNYLYKCNQGEIVRLIDIETHPTKIWIESAAVETKKKTL